MTTAHLTAHDTDATLTRAWQVLEAVPDPEIPVVSIRELGILRELRRAHDGTLEVMITPTYSGCPAMSQIAEDIGRALDDAALAPYRIVTVLAPAWTTDWITVEAREKLRAYGIAPPGGSCAASAGDNESDGNSSGTTPAAANPARAKAKIIRFVARPAAPPCCPRCGSAHTERLAQFGSTACKALYRCLDCREPFDYFKPY